MKKLKIITAIAAVLFCSTVLAQTNTNTNTNTTTTTTTTTSTATPQAQPESSGKSFEFNRGYIGGMFIATVADFKLKSPDNSTVETSFDVGYGGGGLIGLNFSPHVGAQLEVLYSTLAQKFKDPQGIERRLTLNYINVPLLLVLNTDVRSGLNLNFCAGPQIGFNTGSKISSEPTDQPGVDEVNAVVSVKTGDLGFAFGAGLDFHLGESMRLSVGYRGVRGLIDISEDSQNTTTHDYYVLDRAHVNTNSAYAGLAVLF